MKFIYSAIALCFLIFANPAVADMNSEFILPSGVEVKIVEAHFQRAQFNVEGCSDRDATCRINGHIPFGIESGLPTNYVKSIIISFQGSTYSLDVSNMYDAWVGRPLEHPGKIRYFGGKCFDVKNCQFRGIFSDAAATFVAEWLVTDGQAFRTTLTSSNDVVNLFMKNIDPPEFD